MISIIRKLLGTALAATIGSAGFLPLASVAQAQVPAPAQAQPTAGAGVAGITELDGAVTIVRGDSGTQTNAVLNAPLQPGDYVATGAASHAQIALTGTSMLRLAQNTQVRMVKFTTDLREVQLAAGTIELSELQDANVISQVDAPPLSFKPTVGGRYRASVMADGATWVTVRRGSTTVYTGASSQTLTPGTTLVATGAYENPSITTQAAIAIDGFDTYSDNLDRSLGASYPYLAPPLAGYTDWNQYGTWQNVPGYGYAWAPNNQGNGWAPYQNGQFVFEPGYGYTWVGAEPWGYAPYHYGSWFYDTTPGAGYDRWMWQPPSYAYQQSPSFAAGWLPAAVGFFMSGSGAGYNGFGSVGWVPLAPGEPYTPWYGGYGQGYAYPATGLTPVNTYNTYAYRNLTRYPVRVCDVDAFRDGACHPASMTPEQRQRVSFVHGAIPIVPRSGALRFSSDPVRGPVHLSQQFAQQHFAQRVSAPGDLSFGKQQGMVQKVSTQPPVRFAPPAQRPAPAAHPARAATPEPAKHPKAGATHPPG